MQLRTNNWNNKGGNPNSYPTAKSGRQTSRGENQWDLKPLSLVRYSLLSEAKREWSSYNRRRLQAKINEQKRAFTSLESAAAKSDERTFLKVFIELDKQSWDATDFTHVIQMALKAGAYLAARQAASEGALRYPDNPDIQKYVSGLAAPKVLSRSLPPNPTLRANREWLNTHSAEYRGQWVAIRNGELLGVSDSLKELTKQVSDRENILFTKVR